MLLTPNINTTINSNPIS